MNNSLIVIIYVNDKLIYARTEVKIDSLIEILKNDDILGLIFNETETISCSNRKA